MRDRSLQKGCEGFVAFGTPEGRKVFEQWSGIDWENDVENKAYLDGSQSHLLRAEHTPADFWRSLFQTEPPASIVYVESSTFAVGRDTIRRRPRCFYEMLLKVFIDVDHVNPEYGHYIERFWSAIFFQKSV